MSLNNFIDMFYVDILSIVMICLISFVGSIVYFFSRNYMKGDVFYRNFSYNIFMLLLSVMLMTITDNLLLFLVEWFFSNWTLTKLITHKSTWKAAKSSGQKAFENFRLGSIFIFIAFLILKQITGSYSIQYIVKHPIDSLYSFIALLLLLIAASTQSAIWPFHRWLISSLNSPTPVSAIMHAGIVSAGGFLLVRFAPLYFYTPSILPVIFSIGLVSALVGSLWKLMQHDVKRMLACSTIAQMGCMFIQFGLGLFGAAVAHICWHGMFKAYQFLASGSAAQQKKVDINCTPHVISYGISFLCGLLGAYIFSIIHSHNACMYDSSLIVIAIVFIACAQLSLTVLGNKPFINLPVTVVVIGAVSTLYAVNIYFFDFILASLDLNQPQPLTMLHIVGMIMLIVGWLAITYMKHLDHGAQLPNWLLRLYVKALNSSQPYPCTITTYRNGYDYLLKDNNTKNQY